MNAASKVVGMRAGGREHIVATVAHSDPVLLVPEPDNPHDPHAIAVYTAPRSALSDPVVSSVKDGRYGVVSDRDRRVLMDRQAGYLPRGFAATLRLPADGVVGYVSAVRYAPPEYVQNPAVAGDFEPSPPRVAGFDVTARWPRDVHDDAIAAAIDR
jgi:hypothetical protein